jgi:hypothetical protein
VVGRRRRGGDELGPGDHGGEVGVQENASGAEVTRLQVSQCACDVDAVVPAEGAARPPVTVRRRWSSSVPPTERAAHWRGHLWEETEEDVGDVPVRSLLGDTRI